MTAPTEDPRAAEAAIPDAQETLPGMPAGPVAGASPFVPVDPSPATGKMAGVASQATVVIEGDIAPRRLRRPADILRFIAAIIAGALIVGISYVATATTSGLESDLNQATTRIPGIIITITSVVAGLGFLGLPIAVSISLLIRKRGRQLIDALAALVLAVVIGAMINVIVREFASPQMLQALTGTSVPGDVNAIQGSVADMVALITVARLIERPRWAVVSILVLVSINLVLLVGGQITIIGVLLTLLLGWAVGLLVRYVAGTPSTRPSGLEVAAALENNGYPLAVLRASSTTRGGRRYTATTRDGQLLDVVVLDRDLEGDGLLPVAWRSLRVREDSGGAAGLTMSRRLERASLQSYAFRMANVPTPSLLAVSQVGPDSSLMAFETLDAEPFAALGEDLTDGDLDRAWQSLKRMQFNHVSHRTLSSTNILRDPHGGVWFINGEEGSIAAGDVALRLDVAEMLCTQALLVGAERAIASGRRVLGLEQLSRALPVLQPVGLSPATRSAMRKRKDLMVQLRETLLDLNPGAEPEQIQLERLRPRTLLTVIAGTIAAYVLLTQLAQVNLAELASQADWRWVIPALLLSAATYIGAGMALTGFVPEKLSLLRTMVAQLAASFATLVSPPTLGAVAVNVRYLQKSEVHPALAAASVGVSQVMAFVMHIVLLLGFGILAGSQSSLDLPAVPGWAFVIVALLIIGVLAAVAIPQSRGWMQKRVQPILSQVGPRLLTLTQRPAKLAEGIGGILLLNIGYCLCLVACVRAFGGGGTVAAIAVVYLAGATLGQAAPTPGGLGAVEAALSAGLTAAGVEAGVAVSAVLLFRLVTFWLPTIPGWFSFNWLQKNDYL